MPKLAAQLYTVRDYTKTREGFDDVLATCHGIGFEGVQLSAVGCMEGENPEVDAQTAREMLDAHGLVCCATHRPWSRLLENVEEEISFHETLGCDYVAIGGIWEYGQDPEAYRRFIGEAIPLARKLQEAGIRFGYHNHSHEWIRDENGRPCYDMLMDADPILQLEIDTYWVAHAGADPAQLLTLANGRVPVIHVKDMEVVPKEGPVMAPVGEGNLNWATILEAADASGVEWLVVEQDICRRDAFDCLNSSFEFLSRAI